MIDAQQFQLAFYEWALAVNEIIRGQIFNIDEKCLRGSNDQKLGKRAIYMVSAWATENKIVLGSLLLPQIRRGPPRPPASVFQNSRKQNIRTREVSPYGDEREHRKPTP